MLTQRLYITIILCLLCFSAAGAQPDSVGRSIDTPLEALETPVPHLKRQRQVGADQKFRGRQTPRGCPKRLILLNY
jgi:hypothetical protein